MRFPSLAGLTCAVLSAALLSQGCRTINRSRDRVTADDIPFETAGQPSRIARSTSSAPAVAVPDAAVPEVLAPDVDSSVGEVPVSAPVAEAKPVAAKPVAEAKPAVEPKPAAVKPVVVAPTAKAPEMDTTPYEVQVVKSADEVGKPGSYVERVIPEGGGDRTYPIESEGLQGSTGRHVPAPVPAPEPVPVAKPAPAGSGVYVVQAGDILGRIALKHGVSRQAILDANPSVKDPNKLKIGQKLKIPPRGTGISDKPRAKPAAAAAAPKAKKSLPPKDGFTVYTVKKGDILGRIAIAHKTTQKAIREANGLVDANKLREGQQLYVPAPGAKAAPAAEDAAPAKPAAKTSGKSSGKTVKVIEKPAETADAPEDQSADDILRTLGL